jgi:hypothetical protein
MCKQRTERGQLSRPLCGLDPEDKSDRWDRRTVDAESSIPESLEAHAQALDRALAS